MVQKNQIKTKTQNNYYKAQTQLKNIKKAYKFHNLK